MNVHGDSQKSWNYIVQGTSLGSFILVVACKINSQQVSVCVLAGFIQKNRGIWAVRSLLYRIYFLKCKLTKVYFPKYNIVSFVQLES